MGGGCTGFAMRRIDHRADSQGVEIMSADRIEALSRSLADGTSRRSLLRLVGVGTVGTVVGAKGLNEVLAKKKGDNHPLANIPVQGTTPEDIVAFTGEVDVKKFVARNDQLFALATLTGTLEKNGKDKKVKRSASFLVEDVAVSGASGSEVTAQQTECEVLHLELGPINLNLLGLELTIEGEGGVPIIVDITADPSGGLLGQLLCSLAGLLDGGPLNQIARLLTRILRILQGL
jgi:hypothetical protein